jgi:transposase InsO family protein
MKALEGQYTVSDLCRAFSVSRSGYHDWRRARPSVRAEANGQLDAGIREVYQAHRGRYGSPRVTRELKKYGTGCSENRVARRMKTLGLAARPKKGFIPRTTDSRHGGPICANRLLEREKPRRPHEVWFSDITYIATAEGWLYLAGFLDAATRRLVGWSVGPTLEADLVCRGLTEARARHRPQAGLLIHSDRGSQYASRAYRQILKEMHAVPSMSRRANCYDNAMMESFWSSLKAECFASNLPATHRQARQMIFEYIETYYNRVRLPSSLGYLTPVDFENQIS